MSTLVPSEAIALLYRRYLKAANRIPNVTIRMLLLQQIRFGFKRHQTLSNVSAQRELLKQAHKDLNILEDERLSRTLYINKLGLVSCLDWEVRRTEYNVSPKARYSLYLYIAIGFSFLLFVFLNAERTDKASPEIAQLVRGMAMRLEADTPEELVAIRERQVMSGIERKVGRLALEDRILSSFYDAPKIKAPTLRDLDGTGRRL